MKTTKKPAVDRLKIIPVGGLDTIGRNMTLFEYKDQILIVDCGIMFPTAEMHGIDFIIPDFNYVRENRDKVKGIVITHGHEDHIGAVSFLLQELNVPLFGTRLTLGLIRSRLEDKKYLIEPKLIEIQPRDIAEIGSFKVDFIRVNHSIVDGVGIAITTDLGTIIHTGDFKIDFSPVDGKVTDMHHFAEYGEKGVLLLMCDSTNAERPGYTGSESVIFEKMNEIFSTANGRIIVATFASNINRIQQVLDSCKRYNRKVVISGRTMVKNIEIARDLGYLSYKDEIIIEPEAASKLPDKKVVIICTGTQGEPMSALSRMANGTHRHFQCGSGDRVIITASIIPGNERTVGNVINSLLRLGVIVHYEQDEDIHVSGHASQEEIKVILTLVRPSFYMPIHGEYKHLKANAKIAESLGIKPSRIIVAENGDILELTKTKFEKKGKIQIQNVFVDGSITGDLSSGIIKERQTMSSDGIIFVTLVFAEGLLMHPPVIVTRGFAEFENEKIRDLIYLEVENRINKLAKSKITKTEVSVAVKRNLKNLLFRTVRRTPLIDTQIIFL
ncbi:MAG: ribonuclease J [Spirochaetes bacterium]|nr:ribonuclease J [Spirochaetota bacterium]